MLYEVITQVDIILITAAKEAAALRDAKRGGAFDYIIKPLVLSRFEDSLRKFRQYRQQLDEQQILEQQDVDQLLHASGKESLRLEEPVPKGIDPLTLQKIRQVFEGSDQQGLNAEEVGLRIGASRSTARRYLEYLVSRGFLRADVVYGTVGRPERKYS